jgi:hypothetical protein
VKPKVRGLLHEIPELPRQNPNFFLLRLRTSMVSGLTVFDGYIKHVKPNVCWLNQSGFLVVKPLFLIVKTSLIMYVFAISQL